MAATGKRQLEGMDWVGGGGGDMRESVVLQFEDGIGGGGGWRNWWCLEPTYWWRAEESGKELLLKWGGGGGGGGGTVLRESEMSQGVIYPVSHRSLRINFGALRNNCESQSEKVRIEKIERETVHAQPCIANGDRSRLPAIMDNAAAHAALVRGRKRLAAPCRLKQAQARSVHVDDGWSKPHQLTASVKTTSFASIKKKKEIVFA